MSRDIRVVPPLRQPAGSIPTLFGNDGNGATGRPNTAQYRALRVDCAAASTATVRRNSPQFLPAPLLVRLPIGDIEALRLALAPALARGRDRVGILSVNDEHNAPIGVGIRGHRRAVDQKAHRRTVRVVAIEREQDRLLACLSLA